MSTITVKELAAPTGYDLKIAAGETLDLKSQGTVTMPTGSVIQVVSELNNTALVWTDGSQQTAVTKSITVQEGNKVLMNFVGALSNESVGTGAWSDMAFLYLYQDNSSIRELEHDAYIYVNGSNHRVYNVTGSHLTGALSAGTYAFSLQVDPFEANSFSVNRNASHPSSMILMEVVA